MLPPGSSHPRFLVGRMFTQRLENLENKHGHGKDMEHKELRKESWKFVMSHGILPILPLNFIKNITSWVLTPT